PGNPRSPTFERGRHRAAHHCDQQTDGKGRDIAGNRDARFFSQHHHRRWVPRPGTIDRDEYAGRFKRRRAGRLWRDQGEDPPGSEALHREKYVTQAIDHAGHTRDLTWLPSSRLRPPKRVYAESPHARL